MTIFLILISAIFVNNIVLAQFLGICPFLGVSKQVNTAIGMSLAVTFVMALSTCVTWILQKGVLEPLNIEYMQTVTFILVIAGLVQMVEIILKKISPALYQSLGIFLPLITTNCAVLGVALMVVQKQFSFGGEAHSLNLGESVVFAIASAIGFGLAITLMAAIREQLESSDVPKPFRGVPIALLTAGIMALAFMGFSGMV